MQGRLKNITERTRVAWERPLDLVRRSWLDVQGQDLVEYALMAAFIAVAAGAIFPTTLAPNISTIFSKVTSLMALT